MKRQYQPGVDCSRTNTGRLCSNLLAAVLSNLNRAVADRTGGRELYHTTKSGRADRQTDRQADNQAGCWLAGRLADRQADRQANRQANRSTLK